MGSFYSQHSSPPGRAGVAGGGSGLLHSGLLRCFRNKGRRGGGPVGLYTGCLEKLGVFRVCVNVVCSSGVCVSRVCVSRVCVFRVCVFIVFVSRECVARGFMYSVFVFYICVSRVCVSRLCL